MTNANDSAHPVIETVHVARWNGDSEGMPDTYSTGGMTKREYFAANALRLFYVDKEDMNRLRRGDKPDHKLAAKFCVDLADALIAELNKEQNER